MSSIDLSPVGMEPEDLRRFAWTCSGFLAVQLVLLVICFIAMYKDAPRETQIAIFMLLMWIKMMGQDYYTSTHINALKKALTE